MNISDSLKAKRDAEARYRSHRTIIYNSGDTGASVTDGFDTTDPGVGIPSDGSDSPFINPFDPPSIENVFNPIFVRRDEGVAFCREFTFENQKVWFVVHDMGKVPSITVWTFSNSLSFGIQPFGISEFGGKEPDSYVVDMTTPEIARVSDNIIRVTWQEERNGKVVVVG